MPDPLTTETSCNIPKGSTTTPRNLSPKKSRGKLRPGPSPNADAEDGLGSTGRLKKPRSKGNLAAAGHARGHSRQISSLGGNGFGGGMSRGNVMDLFDVDQPIPPPPAPLRGATPQSPSFSFPLASPRWRDHAATIPATPLLEDNPIPENSEERFTSHRDEEHHSVVKDRLSTFSFGSKAPANPIRLSPSPRPPPSSKRRYPPPTYPTGSPGQSPTKRLSTPSSRGPSLLVTRPTPLAFSPINGPPTRTDSPGTPPSPAAQSKRRHLHTRSNSISLPNLKLSSRPPSLGIPVSPSFPQSPIFPGNSGASRPNNSSGIQGTRLRFEPSGRGAEAEKEKDEYRRKALEKLTGSPLPDEQLSNSGTEISLPELDDEDTSSVVSSVIRPFSGNGGFNFGRPTSSSSTPGLSWSLLNEDSPPPGDRWSGYGFGLDKEDGLGFGLPLSASSSTASIGLPLELVVTSRPSLQRNLSVLAEVEEPEEGEEGDAEDVLTTSPEMTAVAFSSPSDEPLDLPHETPNATGRWVEEGARSTESIPILAPTPSRLRQLHLVSSRSTTSNSNGTPQSAKKPVSGSQFTPGSPTKGYGMIGRGRPRPLALGTNNNVLSPEDVVPSVPASRSGTARTPQGATRKALGRGSRSKGSSISYVKDDSSSSTASASQTSLPISAPTSTSAPREWSNKSESGSASASCDASKSVFFSPPMRKSNDHSPLLTFSPVSTSPRFSGWGNMPRIGPSRPCPRPKILAGLGSDSKGAGRILGEVDEMEEDEADFASVSGESQDHTAVNMDDTYRKTRVDQADGATSTGFAGVSAVTPRYPARSDTDDSTSSWLPQNAFPRDVAASFSWRDPRLELEMERDGLKEDVELWKARYQGLEERLELEKKEVGVLRDRVRKREHHSLLPLQSSSQGDRWDYLFRSRVGGVKDRAQADPPLVGDRLSAVSSFHPSSQTIRDDRDSSALTGMRTQLFALTAQMEQERKQREAAAQRAAELEAELCKLRATTAASAKPSLTLKPDYGRVPTAIITPATPLDPVPPQLQPHTSQLPHMSPQMNAHDISAHAPSPPTTSPTSSPAGPWDRANSTSEPSVVHDHSEPGSTVRSPQDANLSRMRGWGFPARPGDVQTDSKPRSRDRNSFFGLSNPLQRNSIDGRDEPHSGLDLPPFDLAALTRNATSSSQNIDTNPPAVPTVDPRAVSEPLPPSQTTSTFTGSPPLPRSSSMASSASSAISFFSGYLPGFSPSSKGNQNGNTAASNAVSAGRPRKDSSSMFGSRDWLPGSMSRLGAPAESLSGVRLPAVESYVGKGELDFRRACKCCVGDVMEL